jgi:hypothetical protein
MSLRVGGSLLGCILAMFELSQLDMLYMVWPHLDRHSETSPPDCLLVPLQGLLPRKLTE